MSCNDALNVQAYFDGELDASAALAVERHLESCAACAALLADLDATRKVIRQDASYQRPDDATRTRIAALLDEESGVSTTRRSAGRRGFFAGALSGSAATALAALLVVFLILPRPDATGDVMSAHLRALMSDHLIDVASSDRHTVKPWFAGHTDVSPPARDFAAQGFELIGGRADYVDGHRAAVLVYRHGKHLIDVFVWAKSGAAAPASVTRQGYHVESWASGDLVFCAVSDTGLDELRNLTGLIKSAADSENRE